jgi:AraC-like DNA-binding protein
MAKIAPSFLAQLLREIPLFTSQKSIDFNLRSASISKSGALHIFQTGIHCSPVAYLIQYRLAQAAEQLYITQKSVSSIAEETGFTSSGYFCRKFRQYYHMSPNEYRKKKTEEIS